MIRGTFSGITLIAEGNLHQFQKTQNQQKPTSLQKPKTREESLFMNLKFEYNDKFIGDIPFENKETQEKFDANVLERNQQLDMTEIDGCKSRLGKYNSLVSGKELSHEEKKLFAQINA